MNRNATEGLSSVEMHYFGGREKSISTVAAKKLVV